MMDPEHSFNDEVLLESVCCEGKQWLARVSFGNRFRSMAFQCSDEGKLRPVSGTPLALTREGQEVCTIVDRIRNGAVVVLPLVVPSDKNWKFPSVRDLDWSPPLREAWVDSIKRTQKIRWVAQLRLDGNSDIYEIDIVPGSLGPLLVMLRTPSVASFGSYEYDLTRLILRRQKGERFLFPLQLRPRWPTPPDFPALP